MWITSVLQFLGGPVFKALLDKIVPDKAQQAQIQLQIMQMQQAGEFKELDAQLQQIQGQVDINKIEAASTSTFKSGWRPFIGWVCGVAFGVEFLVAPLATWIAELCGATVKFPTLDMTTMLPVVMGMLGLGVYRTAEKIKGVA